MGYTPSAECKLLASVELEEMTVLGSYGPTLDGMGIIILVHPE